MSTGGRFSITSEGELHVREVRDTDGLSYFRCTGRSDIADMEKHSQPANLSIHGKKYERRVHNVKQNKLTEYKLM